MWRSLSRQDTLEWDNEFSGDNIALDDELLNADAHTRTWLRNIDSSQFSSRNTSRRSSTDTDTSRGNYLNCLEFDLIPSPMPCFIPLINWFVNRKWKPITLFSEKFRGDALTLYFPLVDLRYMTRYPPSGRSSVDRESVISKLSEDDFLTDVSRNRSHSGIKR